MHGFNSSRTVLRPVSTATDGWKQYPIIFPDENMEIEMNPAHKRGYMRDYSSAGVKDQLKEIGCEWSPRFIMPHQ